MMLCFGTKSMKITEAIYPLQAKFICIVHLKKQFEMLKILYLEFKKRFQSSVEHLKNKKQQQIN